MTPCFRWAAAAAVLACAGAAQADTNVGLLGDVALAGNGFYDSGYWGNADAAPASSVTDGIWLPLGTQWNTGTVFWSGTGGGDAADTVTVTLAAPAIVTSIALEADNNDDYGIDYRDAAGSWHALTTISPNRSWGLSLGDASFAAVTATAFRITAVGGDGYYSVAEFQAIGAPVPEPQAWALMLAGLAAVASLTARRRPR